MMQAGTNSHAKPGPGKGAPGRQVYNGAEIEIQDKIAKHLFVISPNQSGSTFVTRAIEQCSQVWRLQREGQHMLGYVGPDTIAREIPLTWAGTPEAISFMQDKSNYNWRKTKKAWYFQAQAWQADASIFLTKAPPFLLIVDELVAHFENIKLIFLVRNPYAVVEGICRRTVKSGVERSAAMKIAASHIVSCFRFQISNLKAFGDLGVFVSYEELCRDPDHAKIEILRITPELVDLNFDQKIAVKGMYDEKLRNMNDEHIARLSLSDLCTINSVFSKNLECLSYFGYDLITQKRNS